MLFGGSLLRRQDIGSTNAAHTGTMSQKLYLKNQPIAGWVDVARKLDFIRFIIHWMVNFFP